ncbi:MAG: ABC transporter permease, partial [Eubacterium sp.]
MNKQELIILCWENLWRMKFRTILTIIGVVIGTASIIIMVSIGNGAQQSIIGTLSSTASVTS